MTGNITSTKMINALGVTVTTTKVHSKYKKRYKKRKKYIVSCSDTGKFKLGDIVEITPTNPISKKIRFKVVE